MINPAGSPIAQPPQVPHQGVAEGMATIPAIRDPNSLLEGQARLPSPNMVLSPLMQEPQVQCRPIGPHPFLNTGVVFDNKEHELHPFIEAVRKRAREQPFLP